MRHAVPVLPAALLGALLLAPLAGPAAAADCSSRLTFVRGIIDHDEQTGFVGKDVHDAMAADLDRADQECQAGDDRAAERTISATQRKHGYPVR